MLARVDISFALTLARQRCIDFVICKIDLYGADIFYRAAAQAKPPEVYLRARRNEEEYLISVRNRVQKDLELVDGELPRSTKAEPGHGMGLVNVREVLDRCRCEYTLSCRDRWFRFTCAVPTRKL